MAFVMMGLSHQLKDAQSSINTDFLMFGAWGLE